MITRVAILTAILFSLLLAAAVPVAFAEDTKAPVADSTKAQPQAEKGQSAATAETDSSTSVVIAYYFHGTRRCPTCKKLEAYSQEAIESGFAEQLKTGTLQWRPVNVDEEGNGHFAEDYQLYTKSVVLSKMKGEKEITWKNLDKIWELVRGDKEAYLKYIQDEVTAFIGEG